MNTRALRKLIKWIQAEPRRFDMQQWVASESLLEKLDPPCGTVGCLAGMACHMQGHRLLFSDSELGGTQAAVKRGKHLPVEPLATRLLGLDSDQAARLFYIRKLHPDADFFWPDKFENQYLKAKTQRGRVGAAVRRIEHFIKTRGEE